ncbi:MAG: OsmC family protein [Armatimonadetes bacterium]|nr:OsmC family protein [Armatimonadota bacterium]
MRMRLDWKGAMVFEAAPPSGVRFTMDGYHDEPGQAAGPTPMEALMAATAACTGMDVVSILEKQRQKVTSYRLEAEGERPAEGVYPRGFLTVTVRHFLKGEGLDPDKVARAVQLSDEKYCAVADSLRREVAVHSEWIIEEG